MDAIIADIVIFCTGVVTGAVLFYALLSKIGSLAVDKIITKVVENGYFKHKGVRYTVTPFPMEGTRH